MLIVLRFFQIFALNAEFFFSYKHAMSANNNIQLLSVIFHAFILIQQTKKIFALNVDFFSSYKHAMSANNNIQLLSVIFHAFILIQQTKKSTKWKFTFMTHIESYNAKRS